ncbi:MAG: HlyD family efflux transporter periplasmic adaptor subunit [Treponema sp.]
MKYVYIMLLCVVVCSTTVLSSCRGKTPVYYTGVIEGETCSVSSPVSDRLVSLTAEEGSYLKKGDIIGRIDDTPLILRKRELEASLAQMTLEGTSNSIQLNEADNNLSYYQKLYKKNRGLLSSRAVAEQNVQDVKLQVDKWSDSRRSILVQQRLVKTREDGILLQIAQLDDQISKSVLTSPLEGFVDKIYYHQGEFVPAFHSVADIVDLAHVWCYIYVSPAVVSALKPGTPVSVKLGQQVFEGSIAHINTEAEFTPKDILTPDNRNSMVYGIKIRITNKDNLLKIGQPVDVYPEAVHAD